MNILFRYLTAVFKYGKEEEQNSQEYGRTHHEVAHDQFDESRNVYFKLNEPVRYEYQSLHLELLRLILAKTQQNHCNLLQDDLLRRSHEVGR